MFLFFKFFSFITVCLTFLSITRVNSQNDVGGADFEKREAVKAEFLNNYKNYMDYAYPSDCIDLENLQGADDGAAGGFGGTPIESLSTMIVMNLTETDYFKKAVEVIRKQSFQTTNSSVDDNNTPGTVKLFELTIRLIGGMLSAYQMNGEKPEEAFFVEKTKALADRIKGSWVNGSKIPVSIWNINNQSAYNLSENTNCAEAGTLTLEWDQLTKYTKDDQYRKLAVESVNTLNELPAHFPGLPYLFIYPQTLHFGRQYITIGGGFDSYLEYLLKYPVMLGKSDHQYVKQWTIAVESIQKNLVFQSGVKNYTFLADYDVQQNTSRYIMSHYACFIGGNLAMGGRLLGRDDFTTLGLQLTEGCAATYDETILGIGPVLFGYADKDNEFKGMKVVMPGQKSFYKNHGMYVVNGNWIDQPEVIESIFYAYRITGQQIWRDIAWNIFQNIQKNAETGHGFAPIEDVNDDSTGFYSNQPSFLYSETFKYFYLIFDDPQHYSLDDIVFNTEGMPFKRVKSNGFGRVQGKFPYSPSHYGKNPLTGFWQLKSSTTAKDTIEDERLTESDHSQTHQKNFNTLTKVNKMKIAEQIESVVGMPKEVVLANL